jgi:hypothetical protein
MRKTRENRLFFDCVERTHQCDELWKRRPYGRQAVFAPRNFYRIWSIGCLITEHVSVIESLSAVSSFNR